MGGLISHIEDDVAMEVVNQLPVRPLAYHVPEPGIVVMEPLFPNDFWRSQSQLLTNHHINAALLTLMPTTSFHDSRSIPRHPSFVAPVSIENFMRIVQKTSDMIRCGQVPDPPRPRRIDDPQMKCLIAAAHGTMNPSFVIGDDIHWRVICIDASRQVIYTLDPYGTRNGFPHAVSKALVSAFRPYGKWTVQNSRVPLQESTDAMNCGVWAIYIVLMWEEFLANLERTASRECDFTTFLRNDTRQRAPLLRRQYLRDMKDIRGTQAEDVSMADGDSDTSSDPEACMLVENAIASPKSVCMQHDSPVIAINENGVDDGSASQECDISEHDATVDICMGDEEMIFQSLDCDVTTSCNSLSDNSSSDNTSSLDEVVNKNKRFQLSHDDFKNLFEKFNEEHESARVMAQAMHAYLGSPPETNIVSLQQKIYRERKSRHDATNDGTKNEAPKCPKLGLDAFSKLYDKYNASCDSVKALARTIHVELGSPSKPKISYLEQKIYRERKKASDYMKITPEAFSRLYTKYNGKRDNVKLVARAIHADLGSPGSVTISCLAKKIYCERKRKSVDNAIEIDHIHDDGDCDPVEHPDVCDPGLHVRKCKKRSNIKSHLAVNKGVEKKSLERVPNDSDIDKDVEVNNHSCCHPQEHIKRSFAIEAQVKATKHAYLDLPEHPCSCCCTLSFEASLQCLSAKALARIEEEIKLALKHDEYGHVINKFCSMCRTSLMKGEVPKFSSLHGPIFPDIPEFIKELNPLEARLVAPKLAFDCIYQLPKGGQFGLKGGVISVAADMSKIQTHLPRTFDECATLYCDLKRRLVFNNAYMSSLIRPKLVMQCMNWLKDQPLYKALGVTVRQDWNFMSPRRERKLVKKTMF